MRVARHAFLYVGAGALDGPFGGPHIYFIFFL